MSASAASEKSGTSGNSRPETGNRRRVVIRRSATLQPRHSPPDLKRRFDVTASFEQQSPTPEKKSLDPELQRMVKGLGGGGVASVSSRVDSSSSIRLANKKSSLTSLTNLSQENVGGPLSRAWLWAWSKCFGCARRRRLAKNMASNSASDFQGGVGSLGRQSTVSHEKGEEDVEAAAHLHWGALISSGDNQTTPLFASFRSQGRVTSACLWHACRAVTVGALLIIMGITMAVLGKHFRFL